MSNTTKLSACIKSVKRFIVEEGVSTLIGGGLNVAFFYGAYLMADRSLTKLAVGVVILLAIRLAISVAEL